MFYEIEVKSHVRVSPDLFNEDTKEAILRQLNKDFEAHISKDLGVAIAVSEIINIGDGVIIPGDGAAYYETTFKLFTYKPEMQEVILGKVNNVAEFGVFLDIGAIDGIIHISQTMDDFVSLSKTNVLTGKESRRNLKINDKCRARVIAVSYKDPANPKIGLTMRQLQLGSLKWIEEDLKKRAREAKKKK